MMDILELKEFLSESMEFQVLIGWSCNRAFEDGGPRYIMFRDGYVVDEILGNKEDFYSDEISDQELIDKTLFSVVEYARKVGAKVLFLRTGIEARRYLADKRNHTQAQKTVRVRVAFAKSISYEPCEELDP